MKKEKKFVTIPITTAHDDAKDAEAYRLWQAEQLIGNWIAGTLDDDVPDPVDPIWMDQDQVIFPDDDK